MPNGSKEVHYWDMNFEKGKGWYETQWQSPAASQPLVCGEVTPDYMNLNASAVADVHRYNPNMRLVLCVRDEIERVWSSFMMYCRNSKKTVGEMSDDEVFERLVREDYATRCDYGNGIENYLKLFQHEQVSLHRDNARGQGLVQTKEWTACETRGERTSNCMAKNDRRTNGLFRDDRLKVMRSRPRPRVTRDRPKVTRSRLNVLAPPRVASLALATSLTSLSSLSRLANTPASCCWWTSRMSRSALGSFVGRCFSIWGLMGGMRMS